jgi:hypothetical protein
MPKFQTELVVLLEEVVKTEIEAIPLALLGEDIKLTAMEILVLEEAGIVKES